MSSLPIEVREKIKSLVSETTDETFDLIVNLSGKYLSKKKMCDIKRKAELEVGKEIEESIAKAYQIGINLQNQYQNKELDAETAKESFYSVIDSIFKPLDSDIPDDIHALDYFFQFVEELHREFRFDMPYLSTTKYLEYLEALEELIVELKEEKKLGEVFSILSEFRNSNDIYIIVQVTLQKLINYHEFLQTDYSVIKKKHVDKYLEIYDELSGVYEKFLSLIRTLVHLRITGLKLQYEMVRKKGLHSNIKYIKKTRWRLFVLGFNSNMRNAIAHKTCKIDILKERIEYIDRARTMVLTFKETHEKTRELSALLLIFPHLFVSLFVSAISSMRESLQFIPN